MVTDTHTHTHIHRNQWWHLTNTLTHTETSDGIWQTYTVNTYSNWYSQLLVALNDSHKTSSEKTTTHTVIIGQNWQPYTQLTVMKADTYTVNSNEDWHTQCHLKWQLTHTVASIGNWHLQKPEMASDKLTLTQSTLLVTDTKLFVVLNDLHTKSSEMATTQAVNIDQDWHSHIHTANSNEGWHTVNSYEDWLTYSTVIVTQNQALRIVMTDDYTLTVTDIDE
jgi:hypothetical protein